MCFHMISPMKNVIALEGNSFERIIFQEVIFMSKSRFQTRYVTICGMFCAIAYVLTLVGKLVPNVAGFLSYDPKDVAVVILGFIMGPLASVLVSVVLFCCSYSGFVSLCFL